MSDIRFKGRLVALYARAVGELAWLKAPPKRASRRRSDRLALESSASDRAQRIKELEDVIPHIGKTLRFVMPDVDLTTIKPIRPSKPQPGNPSRGIVGAAFAVLQDASGPLSIAEIVVEMAERFDLDISTVAKRQRYHTAINNGLKRTYLGDLEITRGTPDRFQLRSD